MVSWCLPFYSATLQYKYRSFLFLPVSQNVSPQSLSHKEASEGISMTSSTRLALMVQMLDELFVSATGSKIETHGRVNGLDMVVEFICAYVIKMCLAFAGSYACAIGSSYWPESPYSGGHHKPLLGLWALSVPVCLCFMGGLTWRPLFPPQGGSSM